MDLTASLKRIVRAAMNRAGYEVIRLNRDARCEGFDGYLAAARKAGADVNDWIETVLRWEPALPVLNEVVFPYLESNARVCEIGPGTGRHARHIVPRIPHGTLHLFDHSSWIQDFLKKYFSANRNVIVHKSEGLELDMPDVSVDVVFSNGTFIEMKLGAIFLHSREFARVVKKNGYVIFDYIDIATSEGWRYLESQSAKYGNCYTYHAGNTIDSLFANAGFTLAKRHQHGKSTYVVFRKL
jgi:SAM-dependent methyltransferase